MNGICNLTASALAQRVNKESAKDFMKGCFGKVLKEIVKGSYESLGDLQNLSSFNRILIEDRTV